MKNISNSHSSFTVLFLFIILLFSAMNAYAARQMRILVYPFQNTGSAQFAWLSAGMTDSVIADLGRISGITVISNEDRKTAIKEISLGLTGMLDEETTAKVGKMAGADVIFTGSYSVSGNQVRIIAKLMNVESGTTEKSIKLDGTVEDIFALQDKIVFSLMSETEKIKIADVKPSKITDKEKKQIENKQKPDISAYKLYAKGLQIKYSDPKGALNYFKQALKIDNNYANALREAGFTAGETLDNFSEAIEFLNKADAILKKRNETNTDTYSLLLMVFGNVHDRKGNHDEALEYFLKAKTIKESLGLQNTVSYGILLMDIGVVYWRKGDFDRALEYLMKDKVIADNLGQQNTAGYAALMLNIGLVYWRKDDLNSALEYYMKSKTIRDNLGLQKTSGYAALLYNIATLYKKQGNKPLAGRHYRQAYEIYKGLGLKKADDARKKAEELGY